MAYEITKEDEFLRVVHLDGKWYVMYLPNAPLDFHLIEPVFHEEGLDVREDYTALQRRD